MRNYTLVSALALFLGCAPPANPVLEETIIAGRKETTTQDISEGLSIRKVIADSRSGERPIQEFPNYSPENSELRNFGLLDQYLENVEVANGRMVAYENAYSFMGNLEINVRRHQTDFIGQTTQSVLQDSNLTYEQRTSFFNSIVKAYEDKNGGFVPVDDETAKALANTLHPKERLSYVEYLGRKTLSFIDRNEMSLQGNDRLLDYKNEFEGHWKISILALSGSGTVSKYFPETSVPIKDVKRAIRAVKMLHKEGHDERYISALQKVANIYSEEP
jgi:hypothetical protein